MISNWTCTDPDNLQYRFNFKNQENIYRFKEFNRRDFPDIFSDIMSSLKGVFYNPDEILSNITWEDDHWIKIDVNLFDYTDKQIEEIISTYGYCKRNEFYYDCLGYRLSNEIIAECIFEQESGLY